MSQIKQLLLLIQQGKKIKFIARNLGMSKNTVKSYLSKITDLKLPLEHMLSLEDPVLELLSSGNPAYKDERFEYIKSRLDYYQEQLKQKSVTHKLLWEEYPEEIPSGYGLTQFCFHLNQPTVMSRILTVRWRIFATIVKLRIANSCCQT